MGTSGEARIPLIAVMGNPNTGKSTLFNRLTGSSQRVGNYPGITVSGAQGSIDLDGRTCRLVDLPGAYSFSPASPDEAVVVDLFSGRKEDAPELVICVLDGTNLRRNLYLPMQLADTGLPTVLALNMTDACRERGIEIDIELLSSRLGIPVVPIVASRGEGVDALRSAMARALSDRPSLPPVDFGAAVEDAEGILSSVVESATGRSMGPFERRRLLFEGDSEDATIRAGLERARARLVEAGHDPVSLEAQGRYAAIDVLLDGVIRAAPGTPGKDVYAIDRFLTHRVYGLLAFGVAMMLVFGSIYWLAQPAMNWVDMAVAAIGSSVGAALVDAPLLQSLVVDGIVTGVGSVLIFLPQILLLFLFIALLEDSGYMARAAFLMDRVFAWCGLNGKSFVPMLSSYACAVPAILSTRGIENPRARLTTILVAPLMSCSARLPVYVLLIGAFVQPVYGPFWAGGVLFAMHVVGLLVAIPVAFVLNRFVLRVATVPFLLEMPPYRVPRPRDVWARVYAAGRKFVTQAGTVILAFTVVIWALTYFPRPDSVRDEVVAGIVQETGLSSAEIEETRAGLVDLRTGTAYLEQSYLGRMGRVVQPIFAPAGFDWKITVGIIAAFPAREVIVSTLGIVYSLSPDDMESGESSNALRDKLANATWPDGRPVFTLPVALAVMVFFAFCMQCGSTVAVIAQEVGWRWATVSFVYMTVLAWVSAVAVYQVGTSIGGIT